MQNQLKPKRPEWNIIKLIQWATSYFKAHDIDSSRTDVEILLAHVLNLERIDLYVRYDQPLSDDELNRFKAVLKRRINREPVAYIVGIKGFWSIDLVVTKDVLIPRPESECLVETVLDVLSDESSAHPKRILELGTGSGAVILSLASQHPFHLYFASDVSPNAIRIASLNAKRHHLEGNVHFFSGDWFSPLRLKTCFFDVILSNPPYIKTGDIHKLQPEIVAFEPELALDGGHDGLNSLKQIIDCAHFFLEPGGTLLLEIAHDQKEDVRKMMTTCGQYDNFFCRQDYNGYNRVVQMRKKCCG
jgi:release factor glutamine methyltransferase